MKKNSLKLRSHAKINTHLKVGPARADGFHDLDTNFLSIALHDVIKISQKDTPGIDFRCDSKDVPWDDSNLVVKAAKTFLKTSDVNPGFTISLNKNIPISAGLGGGSSNAAVTLMGLNKLCDFPLSEKEMQSLAAELGSDVPYFLQGGYARGQGRGEILSPLPEPEEMFILLVIPEFGISAAEAYKEFDLTIEGKIGDISGLSGNASVEGKNRRDWFNDLEWGIFAKYSELAEIRDILKKFGAEESIMSGSGSVIVGKFSDNAKAKSVANTLGSGDWAWRVILTRNVTRDGYEESLSKALE